MPLSATTAKRNEKFVLVTNFSGMVKVVFGVCKITILLKLLVHFQDHFIHIMYPPQFTYTHFIYSLCHLDSICGTLGPTIDLLPTYQAFTAHLAERRSGIAEFMGSNPVVALNFFFQVKKEAIN